METGRISSWGEQLRMLTLFLLRGETLRFENVRHYQHDEKGIAFDYTSASDGKDKTATFKNEAVAGTSLWDEER